MTKGISQQIESDATSLSLERSVSLEIIPTMKQGSDYVADQDADIDEDQGQVMGDVHESIAIRKTRRNSWKPSWLTTDMIVTYTLSIVEEAISSTYGKAEISSESKMWKDSMEEKMNSLYKNDNFLFDNPHESNSLYLALLLQESLMAHDDGF